MYECNLKARICIEKALIKRGPNSFKCVFVCIITLHEKCVCVCVCEGTLNETRTLYKGECV